VYEWVKNETRSPSATIYLSNITLNRAAIEYLDNPWYVMLGVNRETKQIAIRLVSQHEVAEGMVAPDELYKISIARSYGRIANRSFCTMINDLFELNLSAEAGRKYPLLFDTRDQILVIDLGRGEVE